MKYSIQVSSPPYEGVVAEDKSQVDGWTAFDSRQAALSALAAANNALNQDLPDWTGFLAAIREDITNPVMDALAPERPTVHAGLFLAFRSQNEAEIAYYWNAAVAASPAFVAALNAEYAPGQTRAERIREILGTYADGRSENYSLPLELNSSLNLVPAS